MSAKSGRRSRSTHISLISEGEGSLNQGNGDQRVAALRQTAVDAGRHFQNGVVAAAVERETERHSASEDFERAPSAREREVTLSVAEGFPKRKSRDDRDAGLIWASAVGQSPVLHLDGRG